MWMRVRVLAYSREKGESKQERKFARTGREMCWRAFVSFVIHWLIYEGRGG